MIFSSFRKPVIVVFVCIFIFCFLYYGNSYIEKSRKTANYVNQFGESSAISTPKTSTNIQIDKEKEIQKIVDTNVVTSPSPTNSAGNFEKVIGSPLKEYKNQQYGITFSYPSYWGEPQIRSSSGMFSDKESKDWVKNCLSTANEDLQNIEKISDPVVLSFDNAHCGQDECGISLRIFNFDDLRYYQFFGYEGSCHLTDIHTIYEDVKNKSNLVINGHLARSTDISWGSYSREIQTFPNSNQLFEISGFYQVSTENEYNRIPRDNQFSIDALIKVNPNNPSFDIAKQFFTDLRLFSESLIK